MITSITVIRLAERECETNDTNYLFNLDKLCCGSNACGDGDGDESQSAVRIPCVCIRCGVVCMLNALDNTISCNIYPLRGD